jgi:hypothetical protein
MSGPSSHLATAAFWIALLSVCGWQASADQVLRPPMPIPNVPAPPPAPKVVALMPPTVPLTRSAPTPIPPAIPPERPIPAMMPILPRVALPPTEFDRPYAGQVVITKWNDYSLIRHICKDVPSAIACSYRTYDGVSGEALSCLIMLGPVAHNDARVMQHEMAHCNGWPGDHPGARYSD